MSWKPNKENLNECINIIKEAQSGMRNLQEKFVNV